MKQTLQPLADWHNISLGIGTAALVVGVWPWIWAAMGGVYRRGADGLGPLTAYAFLAVILGWGVFQLVSGFADAFIPGRAATRVGPVTLLDLPAATSGGPAAVPPAGGDLATAYLVAATEIAQLEAENRQVIGLLKDRKATCEVKRAFKDAKIEDELSGRLMDLIKAVPTDQSGPPGTGVAASAPAQGLPQVRLSVAGTDVGPLIAWAVALVQPRQNRDMVLRRTGPQDWQLSFNEDTAHTSFTVLSLQNTAQPVDAMTAFAWEHARTLAPAYKYAPALRALSWQEYAVLMHFYHTFLGQFLGIGSANFKFDRSALNVALKQAIGVDPKAGPAAQTSGTNLRDASKDWQELSHFLGVLADAANEPVWSKVFLDQEAQRNEQGNETPAQIAASLVPTTLSNLTPDVIGLVSSHSALLGDLGLRLGGRPVTEKVQGGGGSTSRELLVVEAPKKDQIGAAYALQTLLNGVNKKQPAVVILDLSDDDIGTNPAALQSIIKGAGGTKFYATSQKAVSALNAGLRGTSLIDAKPLIENQTKAPVTRQALVDLVIPRLSQAQ